jgi:hypothetical protein
MVRALERWPDGVTVNLPRVSIGLEAIDEIVTSERLIVALQFGQKVVRAWPDTSCVPPQ